MLTAELRFLSQGSPCEIECEQSGNGTGFSPNNSVSSVSITPPTPHAHHLHADITRGTKEQSLATFQKAMLFRESGSTEWEKKIS
jgi:hypothetical protein